MEPHLYDVKYQRENLEYRTIARRRLIGKATQRGKILEIGCGTGSTLQYLAQFGPTFGIDSSEIALGYCRQKGLTDVLLGSAESIQFPDNFFDTVVAIDVLEHLDQDVEAMSEVYRVLRENGRLIVIVPAFPSLWSSRDDRLHHRRRYVKRELKSKLERVGLKVSQISYLDACAFSPFWLTVQLKKDIKTDVASMPQWLNWLLLQFTHVENFILTKIPVPFGISIFCVAHKGSEAGDTKASESRDWVLAERT